MLAMALDDTWHPAVLQTPGLGVCNMIHNSTYEPYNRNID